MNKMIFAFLFYIGCLSFHSCQKEISCDNCRDANKPPIAIAGFNLILSLPVDSVLLNGNGSSDPDGTIVSYLWTKISGSSSFHIVDPGSAKTVINQLAQGIYQFELTVKDNGGLNSKDTIQIIVNVSQPVGSCNMQLSAFGNLSIARRNVETVTAGNKILFAGGNLNLPSIGPIIVTSRVDIYDMVSQIWSTAELSEARFEIAVAVAGNKIFFAGGYNYRISSSRVDIYDASTNSWSIAQLSVARGYISAASAGNKVLFAGGMDDNYDGVDVVDIYDVSTNTWSTNHLNGENIVSATTLNNKIYFSGGGTNKVKVYDGSSNSWSVFTRSEPTTRSMANIAFGNTIYWAGGEIGASTSDKVEMYDVITGKSTFHQLSAARKDFQAVLKNNRILFYTGYPYSNNVDVYDINTQTWSACSIAQSTNNTGIISADNKVYVAGGYINGALTNQVWLLDF